jgi:hypothetical protein
MGVRLGNSPHPKPEAQILAYRHMWIQGIALKNHGYVPFPRGKPVHRFTIQHDHSFVLGNQTGDHVEYCALSATRGPQEDAQLPIFHVQVHV